MNRTRQYSVALVVAALVVGLSVGTASAGGYLTKTRAWVVATKGARYVYLHTKSTTDYAVEPASQCARRSRAVVDCDYQLYDDATADGSTITCDGTIRVRLNRFGRATWDMLGNPSCS